MQEMSSHSTDSAIAVPAIVLDEAEPSGTDSPACSRANADGPESPTRVDAVDDARLVRRHREMLALACGIIVVSLLLIVRGDDHAAFVLLPGWPIPSTCPSQTIFGVDCPGCGLTRSFIFLAHADWHNAFVRNRMGWLLALAVVLQIPYRIVALWGHNRQPLGRHVPQIAGMFLIIALIGNWVLRVLGV